MVHPLLEFLRKIPYHVEPRYKHQLCILSASLNHALAVLAQDD